MIISSIPKSVISAIFIPTRSISHLLVTHYDYPVAFFYVGRDVICINSPKASNGHRFILVAIDYFTKQVEAASYANLKKDTSDPFHQE